MLRLLLRVLAVAIAVYLLIALLQALFLELLLGGRVAPDTVFVLTQASAGHPLWFNLSGSGLLMGATVFGCWLAVRRASAPAGPPAAASGTG